MLSHHIQQSIVERLSTENYLSFSQLKPSDIDNKLFTYHLKIVIREGFVEKSVEGSYSLSSAGQKLWRRMKEKPAQVALRAYSVLFLAIYNPVYGWLMYKRLVHPLKDLVGFMHATPKISESIIATARTETIQRTGLDCTFTVAGCGYFRTYHGEDIDSFTNFTLLYCSEPTGELTPNDVQADYFWLMNPDFSGPDMLPNMAVLSEKLNNTERPFFIEESFHI